MRNISCSHTTGQVLMRSKTVTRRIGWRFLKAGTFLRVVKKAMGLKPGEKIEPLAIVRVTSVRRERLDEMTDRDCKLEGYPGMKAAEFVAMFCEKFGTKRSEIGRASCRERV